MSRLGEGIVVIERYQKGHLTAYSVDEGETYHPSPEEALIDLQLKNNPQPLNQTKDERGA